MDRLAIYSLYISLEYLGITNLISSYSNIYPCLLEDNVRHGEAVMVDVGRTLGGPKAELPQRGPLGDFIASISIFDLSIVHVSPKISHCEYTASYNWLDRKSPTILVPGLLSIGIRCISRSG